MHGNDMKCCHCGKITSVPFKDDYNRFLPDEKTVQVSSKYLKLKESPLVKFLTSHTIYSEVSVFVMSFSVILLLFVDPVMRGQFVHVFQDIYSDFQFGKKSWGELIGTILFLSPMILCMVLPVLAGLYLSLVHAFRQQIKTEVEKTCMFMFAIFFCFLIGAVSGYYLLLKAFMSNWWFLFIIFPTWNLICGLLLMIKLDFQSEEEDLGEMVSDEEASFAEILLAVLVCLVVVGISHFVFKLHWSFVLSMCLIYATNFCRSWKKVFVSDGKYPEQGDGDEVI